ncbi:MAG: putative bifunctional diguanylate cyclase/phosphodiesterase [Oscillospiraceae bacterium]
MGMTADDCQKLMDMLASDSDCVHFMWNCKTGTVNCIGNNYIPDGVEDPLDYIRASGYINEKSLSVFDVFASQIEQGIISGIDRSNLSSDILIRLNPDSEYRKCHVFALFMRGNDNKITDVHFNIRPFTKKEEFDSNVLSEFSSDRAPKHFGNRVSALMAANTDCEIAFIQFDVERFKIVNDTYGVETGDEILKFFSESLNVICSDNQPFCRLTADVFMIVTPFESYNDLIEFIRRIESCLTGYKGIEYRLIFGVAIAEERAVHSRQYGDNASIARKSIKGNALNNIGFYNGEMKSELQKKHTLEDYMYKALLNNEFVMYLQPKYSISSGRIIGAEALARWLHPEKGMIAPADFIPLFEQNGFIVKLDQLIWESACKKIRSWIDNGLEPVPISVNVSREYLNSFDAVGKLKSLVNKYSIPIHLLELEITETIDTEGVQAVVRDMKEAGFTMLMDDFGSGYSSLNMLKTTQFDVLKIDRSFLSEFMESSRGRKIISHTISMSQDIGLDIIAEGVETYEQAQFLKNCGCDSAQGFYYSKPVPAEEFDAILA